MLKQTWLAISNSVVLPSPKTPITTIAGMIAISRVISRRNHGVIRMLRKPSITIWPASVPVRVEFCPDASNATANSMLATPIPNNGLSNLYASESRLHPDVLTNGKRPAKESGSQH